MVPLGQGCSSSGAGCALGTLPQAGQTTLLTPLPAPPLSPGSKHKIWANVSHSPGLKYPGSGTLGGTRLRSLFTCSGQRWMGIGSGSAAQPRNIATGIIPPALPGSSSTPRVQGQGGLALIELGLPYRRGCEQLLGFFMGEGDKMGFPLDNRKTLNWV